LRTLDASQPNAARARGRVGGRPPKMTEDKLRVAQEMYDSNKHTIEAIANTIGVSRKTIYRHLDSTKR
jgi:DNA invertase Pin-like site-specific DNA recombinase